MADDGVSVERGFAADRNLVWALLADTNRYDRALGLGTPIYGWEVVDGKRQMVGAAKQGGIKLRWIEMPYEWIEGQYLIGRRRFLRGPASEGGMRIEVRETPDGAHAKVSAFGEVRSFALKMIGPVVRMGLKRRIEAYLDAIERALEGENEDDDGPSVIRAQALLARQHDVLTSGEKTSVNRDELDRRSGPLETAGITDEVREQLLSTLVDRPDEEVAQMRPFALARMWGLDRREVLRAFLHATEAGLVDLNWQVNCPVCKVAAGVVRRLDEVERQVHCNACNIRYDLDFGANIEAVFRCNSALRDVQPAVYCASSPSFRPHVLAQLRVEPGETVDHAFEPDGNALHFRTLDRHEPADLEFDRAPALIEVRVEPDKLVVTAKDEGDGATLRIISKVDEEAYVLIERGGWSADVVLGSVVTSMPEFMDLFATEAPAAGLELTIGHLAILFTDLTGSTALYERVGDARAFAVVQEHFAAVAEIIAEHEGAIVKTMGDAVMATFRRTLDAVNAAKKIVGTSVGRHNELGIGVKVGVHEGPCLVVRANDRLDFFGTTVNVAARLQGRAETSELVLAEDVARRPAIAEAIDRLPTRRFEAELKGLTELRVLVGIDLSKVGAS